MQKNIYNKKVLLYSGGFDSWLIDKLWKPDIRLFVDVGTRGAEVERKRLPEDVVVVEYKDLGKYEIPEINYLLPLRNLFLVSIATFYGDTICLGSEAGSRHLDNGEEFAGRASDLLNFLLKEITPDRKVRVVTPYSGWSKTQLLTEYIRQGGSLAEVREKTFSCYSPVNGKECGFCRSCQQKREAIRNVEFLL